MSYDTEVIYKPSVNILAYSLTTESEVLIPAGTPCVYLEMGKKSLTLSVRGEVVVIKGVEIPNLDLQQH